MRTTRLVGGAVSGAAPPEWPLHAELLQTVVALRYAWTVPFLARNLGTNLMTVRALANFGQSAANSVLAVTNSPESHDAQVGGGLIALRMMTENADAQPLTAGTRARIRETAARYLPGTLCERERSHVAVPINQQRYPQACQFHRRG